MRRIVSLFKDLLRLLGLGLIGALVVTVRYMLKTPQPLDSVLPGEARLYKWKHGHIFYALSGSPTLPPLVLLHDLEVGGSSYEMRKIVAALSEHYQVYALDLLGFGLSDRLNIPYAASTYIDLYKDFLRDVVGRPATLLASGYSCNHAVALAVQAPERCERLILLSPISLFTPPTQRPWLTRLLQQPMLSIVLYAFLTTPIVLRRLIARKHMQDNSQVSRDDFAHYFAAAHQLGAQYAPLAALSGALAIDVSVQYAHLTQPSLLLWGIRAQESRSQESSLQQTRLIQNAGVHVHEDQPAEVLSSILAWQAEKLEAPSEREGSGLLIAPGELKEEQASSEVELPEAVVVEAPSEASQPEEATPPDEVVHPAKMKHEEATSTEPAGEVKPVEAYCVKCRQKRFMQNTQAIVTKNGRHAMEGTCPVCGTRLFRFVAG